MMRSFILALSLSVLLFACDSGEDDEIEVTDTVTNAVINAEGVENNAYNLPGSDTGAIHENTSEPGVLDKDARDTTKHQEH